MAEETGAEKTEDATAKRLEDARKKGQLPRSKELNTFFSLFAASLGMLAFGGMMIQDIMALLRSALTIERAAAFDPVLMVNSMGVYVLAALMALAPFFAVMLCSVFIGPISLGGWSFSPGSMAPKMERISPMKGLGRIFSKTGGMELVKAVLKTVLVSGVAATVILGVVDHLMSLSMEPLRQAIAEVGDIAAWSFVGFSSALVLIAMIDVPFQLWNHSEQLKMTKQEVKDEMKETDGRPEVKGRIRQLQQEAAKGRMMDAVPDADVVITNPTHYAVALKYVDGDMGAPRVVAKGRDLVAKRIRELAIANKVAIFRAPPLARALFATTDLEQEIPGNLFAAVAQVLAYVYQLSSPDRLTAAAAVAPTRLSIPDEYEDRK